MKTIKLEGTTKETKKDTVKAFSKSLKEKLKNVKLPVEVWISLEHKSPKDETVYAQSGPFTVTRFKDIRKLLELNVKSARETAFYGDSHSGEKEVDPFSAIYTLNFHKKTAKLVEDADRRQYPNGQGYHWPWQGNGYRKG